MPSNNWAPHEEACQEYLVSLGTRNEGKVSVEVPTELVRLTKRGILAKLAKISDHLRLISPETLNRGKLIYRTVCDSKKAWDVMHIH